MTNVLPQELVLSIYPTSRGFGFVLMEDLLSPFDWGLREAGDGDKNVRCLEKIAACIEQYQPDILVLEEWSSRTSRRTARIRELVRAAAELANARSISVLFHSHADVRKSFAAVGAVTRYEVAQAIARRLPGLNHYLPKPRKSWVSEDPRLSIFHAVALAFTFFSIHRRRSIGAGRAGT